MLGFSLYLKVDAKLTTINEITRNLSVKQAKSDSYQMTGGKNHDIERSLSKRWSKTSICEIGNYFWDNPIYVSRVHVGDKDVNAMYTSEVPILLGMKL